MRNTWKLAAVSMVCALIGACYQHGTPLVVQTTKYCESHSTISEEGVVKKTGIECRTV